MDASLRFWWDGGGYRRRQVHEQGLAACGVWGDGETGRRGRWPGSPKRDTQGTGPLGGCGQSPPVSPRDGCENKAAAGRAGSFRRARSARRPRPPVLRARLPALEGCARIRKAVFPRLPARLPALPERQTAPQRTFPRKPAKTRRATQQRLCPTGANSVASAPSSVPCPIGARQRRSTRRSSSPSSFLHLRRKCKTSASIPPHFPVPQKPPQAAGPCSWACRRLSPLPPQPDRNAEHPPPARGVGVRQIRAEGAGRRHCRLEGGDGGFFGGKAGDVVLQVRLKALYILGVGRERRALGAGEDLVAQIIA